MNFIPGQDVQPTEKDDESLDSGGSDAEASFASPQKKPAVSPAMLGLLGAAVVGAGLYFFVFKNGPQNVSAVSTDGPDAVATFLSNGEQHVQLMKQMLKSTDKVVQQFRTYPSRTQIPLERLQTNPFRVAPDEAPTASRTNHQRDEDRATATAAVRLLHLQSIMHGGRNATCMINNTPYIAGQQVDQFTIEQITRDSVIVRTATFRFEIGMDDGR